MGVVASNPSFMAGIPELLVLRLLAGREMYGYELARALKLATAERLSLGEGVLYPALHGLEAHGFLRSRSAKALGRVRIYYGVTARGRVRLARLTNEWRTLSDAVAAVLGATPHD